MKLPRPLLHAARIADEVLFYPALVVVRGELAPVEPDAFGWLAGINDKLLHFAAYFGLSVMAGAAVRRRKTAILGASAWCCWAALEVIQGYVGRDPSVYDEYANVAGVLAGTICARFIVEHLRRRLAYW